MRPHTKLTIPLVLAFLMAGAGATQLKLAGGVVSASSKMQSPCYRLNATIGDASAGYSSSAKFSLSSGLLATQIVSDDVFANGFEDCSP